MLDKVPFGLVLGQKSVEWSCSSCGADYRMTGNEVITRCAKELGTFTTYKEISHSVSDELPNNVDPQIEEITPEHSSREGVYSYVLIRCGCSQVNSVPNLRVGGSGGQEKRVWRCTACHNFGLITGDQLGSRLRSDVIELGQWQPASKPGLIRETEKRDIVTLPRRKRLCSCGSGIQYERCCGKPTPPSDSYHNDLSKKNMVPDQPQPQESQLGPSRASCWGAFIIGVIVASLIHQPLVELYHVVGGNPQAVGLVQSFIVMLPLAPWLYLINERSKYWNK